MFLAFWLAAAAVAGPNPATIDQPRRNFAACLKMFEKKSIEAKTMPDAYAEALKTACQSEATALTTALVNYDVAMGSKRAAAQSNAALDISDYLATAEERYRSMAAP